MPKLKKTTTEKLLDPLVGKEITFTDEYDGNTVKGLLVKGVIYSSYPDLYFIYNNSEYGDAPRAARKVSPMLWNTSYKFSIILCNAKFNIPDYWKIEELT